MDTDLLAMSGASAGTIAIVLLVYKVLKSVVGKKLISNCCGRKGELGLDIQPTTPQNIPTLVDAQNNPYYQGRTSRPREERSRGECCEDSSRIQEERGHGQEGTGSTHSEPERTHPINVVVS